MRETFYFIYESYNGDGRAQRSAETSSGLMAQIHHSKISIFSFPNSSESFLSKHEREVTIFKDGSCEIPMLETISGTCTTAIKNFPNDVHKCSFVFYMVNVEHDSGQLLFQLNDGFSETINGAWSLQSMFIN